MPKAPESIARSGELVLFHVSGVVNGVPAADLSGHALARIAFARLGPDRPHRVSDVPQADINRIRDELLATGKYATKPVTTEVPADE